MRRLLYFSLCPISVTDVVKAIEECKNLKGLELEANTLGVEAAEAIGKALGGHPEFKRALWKDLFTGRLKTEIPQALVWNFFPLFLIVL